MLHKYLVTVDEVTVALSYNSESNLLRIGGHKRFEAFMQAIIINYAELNIVDSEVIMDKMKLRYRIQCDFNHLKTALANMEGQGIVCRAVKTLGRIMR